MLTREEWLCPHILALKYEGLISLERLSTSLDRVKQTATSDPLLLLLDLSELMYTDEFTRALCQYKPLTRLLSEWGVRHMALVIPGEFESPLAALIYKHHAEMGLLDQLTIVNGYEQAQHALCEHAETCCVAIKERSPHG